MHPSSMRCGRYRLPLDRRISRPLVMGVLNITPDSFSDGGHFLSLEAAISQAESMIAAGVDIIDIGGESTRPGAPPLSLQEELRRVMPVVYALRDCGKPLSVDTRKPEVMREVIAAGADMINDINGFRMPGALQAVAESDCGLCIMHMQNEPATMQQQPSYEDVVGEVATFLRDRAVAMEQAGIALERLCVDPGFGFGKNLAHNLSLLKNLEQIKVLTNLPLLVGLSRKSMVGNLVNKPVEQRLAGSIAAALCAVSHGARILRVHDVVETVDALTVWQAVESTK